ncbi:unnamed protein product, partial [marine sediment metagenome]
MRYAFPNALIFSLLALNAAQLRTVAAKDEVQPNPGRLVSARTHSEQTKTPLLIFVGREDCPLCAKL